MELRGLPSEQIIAELNRLSTRILDEDVVKASSIQVYLFDVEGNNLGTQFIRRSALAKAYSESRVIGALNGKFKVQING